MSGSALGPIGEAAFEVLQDATLAAALAGGAGVCGDIPEDPVLPLVWLEVGLETDQRGMGRGGLPEVELRTHVYSRVDSQVQARALNALVVGVLKDAALTITGYAQCGLVVYHTSTPLPDQALSGVKVHEIVSAFTVWCEETA